MENKAACIAHSQQRLAQAFLLDSYLILFSNLDFKFPSIFWISMKQIMFEMHPIIKKNMGVLIKANALPTQRQQLLYPRRVHIQYMTSQIDAS